MSKLRHSEVYCILYDKDRNLADLYYARFTDEIERERRDERRRDMVEAIVEEQSRIFWDKYRESDGFSSGWNYISDSHRKNVRRGVRAVCESLANKVKDQPDPAPIIVDDYDVDKACHEYAGPNADKDAMRRVLEMFAHRKNIGAT